MVEQRCRGRERGCGHRRGVPRAPFSSALPFPFPCRAVRRDSGASLEALFMESLFILSLYDFVSIMYYNGGYATRK